MPKHRSSSASSKGIIGYWRHFLLLLSALAVVAYNKVSMDLLGFRGRKEAGTGLEEFISSSSRSKNSSAPPPPPPSSTSGIGNFDENQVQHSNNQYIRAHEKRDFSGVANNNDLPITISPPDNLNIYHSSNGRLNGNEIKFHDWNAKSNNYESNFANRQESCQLIELDFWKNVEKHCSGNITSLRTKKSNKLLSYSYFGDFRAFENFRVMRSNSDNPQLLIGFDILGMRQGRRASLGFWFSVWIQGKADPSKEKSYGSTYMNRNTKDRNLIEIAGRVVDHWDGDYSVYFALPDYGTYELSIVLDYIYCEGYPLVEQNPNASSFRGIESKYLHIVYTDPIKKTIYSKDNNNNYINNKINTNSNSNYHKTSKHSNSNYEFVKTFDNSKNNNSDTDSLVPSPDKVAVVRMLCDTGHYRGGSWVKPLDVPPTCAEVTRFSPESEVHFVGDSTTRQLYQCFYYDTLKKRCPEGVPICQTIINICSDMLLAGRVRKPNLDVCHTKKCPAAPSCPLSEEEQIAWEGVLNQTGSRNMKSFKEIMGKPNHNPVVHIAELIIGSAFVRADSNFNSDSKSNSIGNSVDIESIGNAEPQKPLVIVANVGLHLMAGISWKAQKQVLDDLNKLPEIFKNIIGPNDVYSRVNVTYRGVLYRSIRPVYLLWRDPWAIHEYAFWHSDSEHDVVVHPAKMRNLIHLKDASVWLHHSYALSSYSKQRGIQFQPSYWLAKAHRKLSNDQWYRTDMRHHDYYVIGAFIKQFLGAFK